jgi:hypothetical protein
MIPLYAIRSYILAEIGFVPQIAGHQIAQRPLPLFQAEFLQDFETVHFPEMTLSHFQIQLVQKCYASTRPEIYFLC